MHFLQKAISVATLATVFSAGAAIAQDHRDDQPAHDNHTYVRHTEWRKGYHMNMNDWNRGEQVDWHAHHLSAPPSGYEWREVDGNYVLAAVATGIIASTIIAAGH